MNKKIILRIVNILICFIVGSFLLVSDLYDDVFKRTVNNDNLSIRYEDIKDEYNIERINFKSGKNFLQGYLYNIEKPKGLIVMSHGIGGGAEHYLSTALYFVDNGYQVFAYDNTACFNSEGKNSVGLVQSVYDLDAALTFIESKEEFDKLPLFLYGHSWGGYAVTSILNFEHNIDAVVSVAGFNRPFEMSCEWGERMLGKLVYIESPFLYFYQYILFGDDLNLSAVSGINNTDTPVLLVHGNKDELISIDGEATVNFKDEITNPNVEYKIYTNEGNNTHGTIYQDILAIKYKEKIKCEVKALKDTYNGKIPADVALYFNKNIDKKLVSKVNEEFLNEVLKFYEKSIENE